MDKKKILVFSTSYYPFIGGAEVAIQEVTRRLKERFDFYIVTARSRRDLPKQEIRPEGIIVRVGFGNKFDKWLFPLFMLWNLPKQIALFWGVDTGQASFAAAFLKLFMPRTPFIITLQYGESEEYLSSSYFGLSKLAFKFMLHRADYVTAISSYLMNLSRKYGYTGSGEVIHNGVDADKFKSQNSKVKTIPILSRTLDKVGATQNSKIIITTSRLVPKNGVDTLISSIYEVKKTFPDIQCWILGDGPEKENYKLQITNYKLENNVKLFGAVPYEKIPEYLHEAGIFVRSSRSEGMGNSFIEALAAGLPIIGTPVGGITDIIENEKTGLFTKPDDPKDLAEKIIKLATDSKLSESIVAEGQKMVQEKFSWDKIAQAYSELLSRFNPDREVRPLSIILATPLTSPQIGGPAQYADNLAREFFDLGQKVKTISFAKYLKFPSVIRHFLYLWDLFKCGFQTDIIFSLDYTSVGIPAAAVSIILRKPLVIRVEGDFLWEKFVERARQDITLRKFYEKSWPLSAKERLIKFLSGWAMRRASKLVFSSEWRRRMVIDAYDISPNKTDIIKNIFPVATNYKSRQSRGFSTKSEPQIKNSKIILWAGRVLYLKNLSRLIRAFAGIPASSYELHLVGDGPEKKNIENLVKELRAENRVKFFPSMNHKDLMEKIALSAAVVLPSLSDVGPNIVAEAMANSVPVIMTKESGYAEIFRDNVIFIDPLDENDLRIKLEKFIKQPAEITFSGIGLNHSWNAAAGEWIKLFQNLCVY